MNSAIALPLNTAKAKFGILILNSRKENFYNRKNFHFLDSFVKQAGGLLQSARLYKELQEHVKQIEELERYQESIFESMTNILITTDEKTELSTLITVLLNPWVLIIHT
jgi:adenylate cyclase